MFYSISGCFLYTKMVVTKKTKNTKKLGTPPPYLGLSPTKYHFFTPSLKEALKRMKHPKWGEGSTKYYKLKHNPFPERPPKDSKFIMIGALLLSSAIFSIAMFHLNHPAGAQADPDGPDGDHLHKLRHVLLRLSLLQLLYVHSDISFQASSSPGSSTPQWSPSLPNPDILRTSEVPPGSPKSVAHLGVQHLVQTGVAAAS